MAAHVLRISQPCGNGTKASLFPTSKQGLGADGDRGKAIGSQEVFSRAQVQALHVADGAWPTLRTRSPLTPAGLSEGTASSAGLCKSKYRRCSYLICVLLNGRIYEAITVYEELSVSALPARGGGEKPSQAWMRSRSPAPRPLPGSG